MIEIKKEHHSASFPHSPLHVAPPPIAIKMPESPLLVALRASVVEDFEALDTLTLINNLDGPASSSGLPPPKLETASEKSPPPRRERSRTNPSPLASVTSTDELPSPATLEERPKPAPPSPVVSSKKKRLSQQITGSEAEELTWMVYNEYGEVCSPLALNNLRISRKLFFTHQVPQLVKDSFELRISYLSSD